MNRETIFSPCRKYRYTLWREWDLDLLTGSADDSKDLESYAMFIGLNPSTADETKDDPTIRRCIGFAKAWGYGALCMTNLFAFRATKPEDMKRQVEPVGMDNIHHILKCGSQAGIVVAAWGANGKHHNQDVYVKEQLFNIGVRIHCLRTISDGSPEHPLYLPKTLVPIPLAA